MDDLVPVGKFIGTEGWVIALSRISSIDLDRATDPLSPKTKILYAERSALTIALTSLMILELTPPQSPLSEVMGTKSHFLAVTLALLRAR